MTDLLDRLVDCVELREPSQVAPDNRRPSRILLNDVVTRLENADPGEALEIGIINSNALPLVRRDIADHAQVVGRTVFINPDKNPSVPKSEVLLIRTKQEL